MIAQLPGLPKPAFAIHMNQVHMDTTQMVNYVQREVCTTERGDIQYDLDLNRYVLTLDVIDADRDRCLHLRHQKAIKVWLIMSGNACTPVDIMPDVI